MVNGTIYAKKMRLNTRNGNKNIDIKNKKSIINIPYTRYIEYIVLLINE